MSEPSAPDAPPAEAVTFYWRRGCGFCASLRRRLRAAGVELDERDIWADDEAAAEVRRITGGDETVPTVVVGGTPMVNPSSRRVLDALGIAPPPGAMRSWWQRIAG